MRIHYEKDIELFIDALMCTIPKKDAYYLAVPITTGKRLWDLAVGLNEKSLNSIKIKFPARYQVDVLGPNMRDATKRANKARKVFGKYIIDPSKFLRPFWQQRDYKSLWNRVIRQFVRGIILSPGWNYSQGCVTECILGIELKVSFYGLDGACLTIGEIYNDIKHAQEEGQKMNLETCFLAGAQAIINKKKPIYRRL